MSEIDGSATAPDSTRFTPEVTTGTTSDTSDVSGTTKTPGEVLFSDAATALSNAYASTNLMIAGAETLTTPNSDTDNVEDPDEVDGDDDIEEKNDESDSEIEKSHPHKDFSDAQSSDSGGTGDSSGQSGGQSGGQSSSSSSQAKVSDKAPAGERLAVSKTESHSDKKVLTDASLDTSKTEDTIAPIKIFTGHKLRISHSFDAEIAIEIASFHYHQVDKAYQSYRKKLMLKAKEHSSNVSIYLSTVRGVSFHIFQGVVRESDDLTALKYTSAYKSYLKHHQSRQDRLISVLSKLSTYTSSIKRNKKDLDEYTSIQSSTKKIDKLMKSKYNQINNESPAIDQNMKKLISDIGDLLDKIDDLSIKLKDASGADKTKIRNARTKLNAYHSKLSQQSETLLTERSKLKIDNSKITTAQKKLADKKNDLSKKEKASLTHTISSNGSDALTKQASINATLSSIKGIQGDVQDQWDKLPSKVQSSASEAYSNFNAKYTIFNTHESNYNNALTNTQQSLRNYFASTISQLQNSKTELSKYSNNPTAKLLLSIINSKIKFAQSNDGDHSATIVILEEEAKEWHSQAINYLKKNSYAGEIAKAQKAYNHAKAAYTENRGELAKLNKNPLKKPKTEFIPGSESDYGHSLDEMDQLLRTLAALNISSPDATKMSENLFKGPSVVDTSGIPSAWSAYQTYKNKIPGLKHTISDLKIAMEVSTAGAVVSFGATLIAEAAMGITLSAKQHDLSEAENNEQSSFELYTMYKHQAIVNQASNTATWKREISAEGSKVTTLLSTDAEKITHQLKKEEKELKHNVDNLQKILETVHKIYQKKPDKQTQSFL